MSQVFLSCLSTLLMSGTLVVVTFMPKLVHALISALNALSDAGSTLALPPSLMTLKVSCAPAKLVAVVPLNPVTALHGAAVHVHTPGVPTSDQPWLARSVVACEAAPGEESE